MRLQKFDGAGFLIDTSELRISMKRVAVMTTYHMHMCSLNDLHLLRHLPMFV